MKEAAPAAAAVGEQRPKSYGSVATAEDRLGILEHRAHLRMGLDRKRSAQMLFVGTSAGFLGFFLAIMIGVIKSYDRDMYDLNGKMFRSGESYFPSTISVAVNDPSDPGGKCFFCFELTGAIILFMSSYPTMLRNVYVGDDAEVPYIKISWTTFRQFVPAPGMMLLAIITTVTPARADILDQFCIQLHMTGLLMLFMGYFVVEAYTVGWGPFKEPGCQALVESQGQTRELSLRKWCLHGIIFWWIMFWLMQAVIRIPVPFAPAEHFDIWGVLYKSTGKPWKLNKGIALIDSADLDVKIVKIMSYTSEVFCGICMLSSHMLVWYYCEERSYDLAEELPSLNDKPAELSPEVKERLSPSAV